MRWPKPWNSLRLNEKARHQPGFFMHQTPINA